jgi:3-isopropylmalate/(R)-2-methylmalate dehydratase large subunit
MKTLFAKIWDTHIVAAEQDCPSVLYIDLHLIHEVTSPQAFSGLRARGLRVRRPDRTVATMDHIIPTVNQGSPIADPMAAQMVSELETNCKDFGIQLFGIGDPRQGIVHVIGPELGLTQPGTTIVCGDSHTSTHGAFGALAFGIGTSEVEHVLATQCLLQRRPKTFEVRVGGHLQPGVTAKDIILALIARLGVGGGTGHVFEFTGNTTRRLDMDDRLTVCNMAIEAGARAGMIAPDDTTFQYLAGKPFAPAGADWDAALTQWRQLRSDDGAVFDKNLELDAGTLEQIGRASCRERVSLEV